MSAKAALEAALSYFGLGWSVIPLHTPGPAGGCSCGRDCDSPGKHPRLASWKEFQERRPTEEELREWWGEKWSSANLGLVTGRVSGVVVVDLDGEDGVRAVRERGGLPPTPVVRTGKGWHYYFAYPEVVVPTRAGVLPGVDVRGDGGLAVLPPSLHPTGRRYEWARGRSPWEVPLAPCPEWLLGLVRGRGEGGDDGGVAGADRPRLDPLAVLAGVEEGRRDMTLFRYACRLRAQGLSWEEARALVLTAAAACRPPFPEREALKCLRSAWKYPPGTVRRVSEGRGQARLPGRVAVPEGWDGKVAVVTASWELAKEAYASGKAVVVVSPGAGVPPGAPRVLRDAGAVEVVAATEKERFALTWDLYPLLAVVGHGPRRGVEGGSTPGAPFREDGELFTREEPPVRRDGGPAPGRVLSETGEAPAREGAGPAASERAPVPSEDECRAWAFRHRPDLHAKLARVEEDLSGVAPLLDPDLERRLLAVKEGVLGEIREAMEIKEAMGEPPVPPDGEGEPGGKLPAAPGDDEWDSFAPLLGPEEVEELRRRLTADPFRAASRPAGGRGEERPRYDFCPACGKWQLLASAWDPETGSWWLRCGCGCLVA
ncbi:Bifunctional DNA primase/polymerase [Ammonifex degensii KC4]|uniref:Bifunctional DNA primase/polymerase n=1 Tax=Ammonifex degensii (strain DSM 10501 / KC4) TaxID=429009 RepID=C9RCN8_AMMDK|nr:bifunctional DNA primase/polymerase [Ammonifex degensii]ACX52015.1 Bifunctional DNA primase/polymerase [Ammonifex degensii KC4]